MRKIIHALLTIIIFLMMIMQPVQSTALNMSDEDFLAILKGQKRLVKERRPERPIIYKAPVDSPEATNQNQFQQSPLSNRANAPKKQNNNFTITSIIKKEWASIVFIIFFLIGLITSLRYAYNHVGRKIPHFLHVLYQKLIPDFIKRKINSFYISRCKTSDIPDVYNHLLHSSFYLFKGRSTRKEFWIYFPLLSIVSTIGFLFIISLAQILFTIRSFVVIGLVINLLAALVSVTEYMIYGLYVRRLHDVGKSGHWILFKFFVQTLFITSLYDVPMQLQMRYTTERAFILPVSTFIFLVLYNIIILYWCAKKSVDDNKYGKRYEADYFFTQDN